MSRCLPEITSKPSTPFAVSTTGVHKSHRIKYPQTVFYPLIHGSDAHGHPGYQWAYVLYQACYSDYGLTWVGTIGMITGDNQLDSRNVSLDAEISVVDLIKSHSLALGA